MPDRDKLRPRRSYTAGAVPTTSDLDTNEICINYADSKLYVKNASGNIQSVTLGGSGGGSLSATVTIPASDPFYSNVLLLLHGNGNLTDSSGYGRTVTANGNAAATAPAKFGSASFALDGTGDYLSLSSNDFAWGTADYTLEAWVWLTSAGAYGAWFSSYVSDGSLFGVSVGVTNTGYPFLMHPGGANITGSTLFPTGQWVHVAVTRSSNVVAYYLNGVSVGLISASGSHSQSSVVIGRTYTDLDNNYWNGRIDELRVTKGIARAAVVPTAAYSDATPQTVPVTITGSGGGGGGSTSATVTIPASGDAQWGSVVALLSGNGSLADSSIYGRTFSAYGNAAATGPAKFGSASITFNGTTDYITTPSSPSLDLGNNWTIECWIRPASSTLTGAIVHRGVYEASNNSWTGLTASMRSLGSYIRFYFAGTSVSNEQYVDVQQSNFPANTWTHVAMMRLGSVGYVFVNGALAGSVSSLANAVTSSQPLYVGTWYYTVSGADTYAGYWDGQIDELRITAAARYTSAGFTPQTAAFPTGFYTAAQTLPVVFS